MEDIELQVYAMGIAEVIRKVPVEQRHTLYTLIAKELRHSGQNFQGSHFEKLARREKGGE